VSEKNRMLESLSAKLSKYLSLQIYSSIFSGVQDVRIASRRKKLTVCFSDIADFTKTTEHLESKELTDLLNQYLTEMSKIALAHGRPSTNISATPFWCSSAIPRRKA
jgi:adenylate cyclase